jgi:basic amino acid/polyamine antiporter, APA family
VTTPDSSIEPRLGGFDTAMIVVSLVIGIGIFRTPALVARSTGSSELFLLAWILGGLISLLGALTFAEIGSRLPRAGGYYRAVADCYHPILAFMLNWWQNLLQGAGAAGVSFIGVEYLNLVLLPPAQRTAGATLTGALTLMGGLLALNLLGIRAGARTQNVLSLSKIVLIVGLALSALLLATPAQPALTSALPAQNPWNWAGLAGAGVAVFYTYGGYQSAINLGGDVRDARRTLPRAVTGGMVVVVALYLLINFAYDRVLGLPDLVASPLVAAGLARAAFGPPGETVISLAIFLSAAGFVNATIIQMPRTYYAMAEDGALPAAFLRVNPRTQVQQTGLLFFGATMLVPAFLLGSFDKLLSYLVLTDALTQAIVASTLFVLRRRATAPSERSFRMPGYPLLPALFTLCLVGIALRVVITEPTLSLVGLAILLLGAPLFLLARRWVRADRHAPSR